MTKLLSNSWIARLYLPDWALTASILLILIAILWLPFGSNVMGIQEEWRNRAFVEDSSGPWLRYEAASRPAIVIPIALAHALSPDSYVGYNLVQAILFFGKGMMFFFLLRRLVPNMPIVACTAAILFVIYPADEGLMTLRAMPIHFATFCYLAALNFLFFYWDHPNWPYLLCMWVMLVFSLGTYEIAYPLVLVSPLFLLWLEKRLSRRVIRVGMLWSVGWLIPLANSLVRFIQPNNMQRNLLDAGTVDRNLLTIFREMFDALILAYQRHFITGWEIALQQLSMNALYALLAMLMVLFVLFVAVVMRRKHSKNDQIPIAFVRQYLIFALAGVVWVCLALVLYLPTTRRYEDWRVYYLSSAGASLTVTLIILCVTRLIFHRFAYAVFIVLMAILVGLATVRMLHQHQRYSDVSLKEEYILSRVVEQAPTLKKPSYLLFLQPEGGEPLSLENLDMAQVFDAALSYIYQDYGKVLGTDYCYLPDAVCHFQQTDIEVSGSGRRTAIYPYDQVLLFESSAHDGIKLLDHIPEYLLPDFSTTNYDPAELVNSTSQPPRRVHTLFTQWPVPFNYPIVARDNFADFAIPEYDDDTALIFQTSSVACASQSECTIQRWLSGDVINVPDSRRFYITPDRTKTPEQLEAWVSGSESVWFIRTDVLNPPLEDYLNALRMSYVPFRTTPWNGQDYPEITIYRKKPDSLQDLFLIGNSISLQNWSLHNDVNVRRCQSIQLSTWWLAKNHIDANYSMTLVLADSNGIGIARTDGSPSNFLPQLWQVGENYLDERALIIPCDVQSGQYSLLIGLYNYETLEALPVAQPDGSPASSLIYLTTINVN